MSANLNTSILVVNDDIIGFGKIATQMQNVVLCMKQSKNKYVTYHVLEFTCHSNKLSSRSQALHCQHNTREAISNITFLESE